MTISSSIDFSVTRDDIITEALELLGVLGEGESPTTAQITSMSRTLNSLVKAWQADDLNLFAVQRLYMFPEKGQHEYRLSATSSTNITSTFRETTVSADVTSTTVNLTDDVSLIAGDKIGIALDATTVFWTTISSVTSALVLELFTAVPSTVASGNTVYIYTTRASRPMRILEAYVKTGEIDVPVEISSRRDYNSLGLKTSDGQIQQIYYDPQISTGTLFVYPETNSELNYLVLFVQKTLADMDSGTNSPEIPQEWFLPLAYNLARVSIPKYGTPQMDGQRIIKEATYWYELAQDFDSEHGTSMQIVPNT